MAGLRTGGDLEQAFRRPGELQPDFLFQLAQGAGVVAFAGLQMAGRRRVPGARETVFLHRALLQEEFAFGIEHQHVHCAVIQFEAMDFAARLAPDDFIALVDDVKDFFAHGFRLRTKFGRVE